MPSNDNFTMPKLVALRLHVVLLLTPSDIEDSACCMVAMVPSASVGREEVPHPILQRSYRWANIRDQRGGSDIWTSNKMRGEVSPPTAGLASTPVPSHARTTSSSRPSMTPPRPLLWLGRRAKGGSFSERAAVSALLVCLSERSTQHRERSRRTASISMPIDQQDDANAGGAAHSSTLFQWPALFPFETVGLLDAAATYPMGFGPARLPAGSTSDALVVAPS